MVSKLKQSSLTGSFILSHKAYDRILIALSCDESEFLVRALLVSWIEMRELGPVTQAIAAVTVQCIRTIRFLLTGQQGVRLGFRWS